MDSITLSTFNVRGSRNPLKRDRIRNLFKSHQNSIVCLQETHCKNLAEANTWANEWIRGEPSVWKHETCSNVSNNFTTRSRGTMTLMDDSNIKLIDQHIFEEGRAVFTLIKIMDFDIDELILVNIYAPNDKKDRCSFFKNLHKEIENWQKLHNCDQLMVTGDFNCITDAQDRSNCKDDFRIQNDVSSRELVNLINELNLVDVWRKFHPDIKQFTWRQVDSNNVNRNVAVRLDKWYVSPTLIGNIDKCYIVPCTISDHLPVMLKMKSLRGIKRGKGFWKFNNSLLDCEYFCRNIEEFWEGWRILKPTGKDILEWWEAGKSKIKEIATNISKQKAKIRNEIDKILKAEFQVALFHFDSNPSAENAVKLQQAKFNLERVEKENIKGLKIRARVKWCEKGETSDKYFINLEKYRGKLKTVTKIRKEDGTITEKMDEILETQSSFYKQLYTESVTDNDTQVFFLNSIDKKLDDNDRDECEGLINLNEAYRAMKNINNNKSPGSDGLSKEFFSKFWDILGNDLVEVFNTAYTFNCLTESQKNAIITLLYKNGEKEDVKNWRPISLLNADFKILAKCLANRLKKCMDKLVHPDQTCGIKGRTIFENIIFAQDAIFAANKLNKPLAIISLDQTKAFDRLNHGFMFKILKKFGFGDSFINWIKTLYTDINSQICTNGYVSEPFNLERGVRQGCPLSPMIYTLATESLLCAIRKSNDIKGFQCPDNKESKVKGYADDTAVYVRDMASIQKTIDLVNKFGLASESKINLAKTYILLCGPLIVHQPVHSDLNYERDKIKLLGVWVGNTDTTESNWRPVVNKITKTLGMWSYRDLTVKGKSIIVNMLALSKVWYLASVCVLPENICTAIEEIVKKFLTTSKTRLVKRDIWSMPEMYGGINCIDIRLKAKSLKVKWLLKIVTEKELCSSLQIGKYFVEHFDNTFKGINVITTNLRNVRNVNVPCFYQDMIQTWQSLKFERKIPNSKWLLQEYLFANPIITNNGTTLYFLNWLQKNIVCLKDILSNNRLITVEELIISHNILPNMRNTIVEQFRIIINAIPVEIIQILNDPNFNMINDDNNNLNIQELYKVTKQSLTSRQLYYRLLFIKLNGFQLGYKVFENAGIEDNNFTLEMLKTWWNYLNKSELDNKTKEFQWQLSHKALYTFVLLHQIDEDILPTCILCKIPNEDLEHTFVLCTESKLFWEWIFREFAFHTTLDKKFVYINNYKNMTKLNFLITMLGKRSIWDMRGILRKSPNLNIQIGLKVNFKYKVQSRLNTLYQIYLAKNSINTFEIDYLVQDKIVIDGDKIILNIDVN